MRKSKYTAEEKIAIIRKVVNERKSRIQIAQEYGIPKSTLRDWIHNYQSMGAESFFTHEWGQRSEADKEAAVFAYLNGEGSLREICNKFKISSTYPLRQWILKYNSHEKLKASRTGGIAIMTQGRKTTFDERVDIVKFCIENNHNYSKTAETYKISYQQARNYTIKYEEQGVEGLKDNRGKRKNPDMMTELEKLRAENKLLRAEKERTEMELSFLKKLEEIERRRG